MINAELVREIALAALIGAMQQAIQHWFPWQLVLRRELPRVAAYVIGTLAYLIPITVLFICWQRDGREVAPVVSLATIWACVIASGLAVVMVRLMDWVIALTWDAREARQREEAALSGLREVIDHAQG